MKYAPSSESTIDNQPSAEVTELWGSDIGHSLADALMKGRA
jgi:hypothetical protein